MPSKINFSKENIERYLHESNIDEIMDFQFESPNQETNAYIDTVEENEQLLTSDENHPILYTLSEVASLLGLSYDFIRNAAIQQKIKAKRFGRRRMVHYKEVARIITEGI